MTEGQIKFLHTVARLPLVAAGLIYKGWLVALSWALVAVPLGFVAINLWQAVAIMILGRLMFLNLGEIKEDSQGQTEKWVRVLFMPVIYTIIYAVIWLLSKGF